MNQGGPPRRRRDRRPRAAATAASAGPDPELRPRYPFHPWLQKGYARTATQGDPEKRRYNLKFSQTRWVVEAAIGKLKGQWRCLLYGLPGRDVDLWSTTTSACIILHNISIDECGQGLRPTTSRPHTPPAGVVLPVDPQRIAGTPNTATHAGASSKREQLRAYIESL